LITRDRIRDLQRVGEQRVGLHAGAVIVRRDRVAGLRRNALAEPGRDQDAVLARIVAGCEEIQVATEPDDLEELAIGRQHGRELPHHVGDKP
jgi:hypothetical protein